MVNNAGSYDMEKKRYTFWLVVGALQAKTVTLLDQILVRNIEFKNSSLL